MYVAAWLAACCSAVPTRALADEQPQPPSAELAAAKAHFQRGMQAFESRDFRAAIQEFEAAVARAPSAELWFDLARAYEELAEYSPARAAYERYLRDSVDAPDAASVRERVAALARLEDDARQSSRQVADTGTLRVRATPEAAWVMLDGRMVGRAPLDGPLALRPGSYRLDVVHPGFIPLRAEVQVEQGMLTAAYADLMPLTAADSAAPERTWTWLALALTGATLLGSGAFAAAAVVERRQGEASAADRFSDGANVTLGGAVLCAAATMMLYVIEGHAHSETVSVASRANPRALH